MKYLDEAKQLKARLVELRRHFHMHPEPSRKEFQTAEFIAAKLQELGYEVTTGVGASLPGVVGILRGQPSGKTVALRADMDATSIQEQNVSSYRSKVDGVMHSCGHDAHMAILLGTAELLARHRNELKGTVKLIFQPSEEIYGGAVPMIEDGVLQNPDVDAIFGLHMDPSYPVGQIGISYGETLASSDRIILKIKGVSSHGATPHLSRDAIIIAAHVLLALQSLISREKDPLEPAVLSFGIIQGGNQPNAIAEEVLIRGILRTFNPLVREQVCANIERIVRGITDSFEASYEFIREKSYDALINNNDMVDFFKGIANNLIGSDNVQELEKPRMIVEDFAYFLQKVPGAYFFLGCGNAEKGIIHPLHSSHFDLDEDSLPLGVALETALIFNYLK